MGNFLPDPLTLGSSWYCLGGANTRIICMACGMRRVNSNPRWPLRVKSRRNRNRKDWHKEKAAGLASTRSGRVTPLPALYLSHWALEEKVFSGGLAKAAPMSIQLPVANHWVSTRLVCNVVLASRQIMTGCCPKTET